MSDAQDQVLLSELLEEEPRVLPLLLRHREVLTCIKSDGSKQRRLSIDRIYESNRSFWKHGGWSYYVDRDSADDLLATLREQDERVLSMKEREKKAATRKAPSHKAPTQEAKEAASSMLPNYGRRYAGIAKAAASERPGLLRKAVDKFTSIQDAEREAKLEALTEMTGDAIAANRSTVMEAMNMGTAEARLYTQEVVEETDHVVRTAINFVDEDIFNDDLFAKLVRKSNGTVVQHVTRVFINGLAFMLHYNRKLLTTSYTTRLRTQFARRYRQYYTHLLPHISPDDLDLEHVFRGGLRAFSEPEIRRFGVGYLVHDIGKAEDVEYHEGEAEYDRDTVVRHVKIGYRAVMDKTNYSRDAALIVGYHHEYYGHPSGYGYFREFLEEYKKQKPDAVVSYCMAYDIESLIDYEALGFVPVKMLEIVDVFDSLTDPNRQYREPLSTTGALSLIKEQFVDHYKIDPILFEMFVNFVAENGYKRSK